MSKEDKGNKEKQERKVVHLEIGGRTRILRLYREVIFKIHKGRAWL